MQAHGGDGASNLSALQALTGPCGSSGGVDVRAQTGPGQRHAASLIGYGDFAFEHEHPIFIKRSAPELGAADADIGDWRGDGNLVLLQPLDAA
jgi:hypothetical protein